MPAPIPTTEPETITAGETLAWTKTVPDYPAPTYVLKYSLQLAGQASLITITATASGAQHAIAVAASVTVLYTPGTYLWTSYAEAGLTRYPVARGNVTILPSPLSAQASTHATRTLALIEAALEGRIPRGLENTNIDGQSLERIPIADLFKLKQHYQALVLREQRLARGKLGLGVTNTIGIKFVRPR